MNPFLRAGLAAGVAAPVLYFAIQMLLIPFYPGYDPARDVASDLGTLGTPTAAVFNPVVVVIGLLMISAGAAQGAALARRTIWPLAIACALCPVLLGLASIWAGVYPQPDPRHGAGGAFMLAGVVYPALMMLAFWRSPRARLVFALCLVAIGAAAFVMTGPMEIDRARWDGLIQRPVALTLFGPMALASWALLRDLRRRGV